MPTTTNNNNQDTSGTINNNSNNNVTNKMNPSRSIKVNFRGASHEVVLPTPATLSGLQAAVASAFKVKLAARSEAGGADSDLSFTYMDSDGDDIVFDKDSELNLALRLCPSPLEVSAAGNPKDKMDGEMRIYRRAARNLREYHGVPSMTPPKLILTLAFLELHPRRLVKQGLAPAQLLAGVKAPEPLGSDNNDDLAEGVTSDMELMSAEDDRKEWNDGFVSVEYGEKPTDAAAEHASSSEEEDKPKDVMHGAFLSAGIKLRPREVMPLFLALGVRPRRLVKLGHVDDKELRAVLESVRSRHRNHGGGHPGMAQGHRGIGHPGMARGGGPGGPMGCVGTPPGMSHCRRGDGARGQGGKPCGPDRRVGRAPPVEGVFYCQPPPPPPHADSKRVGGGGGGPGGFSGPHHGHHGHPGRYGGGGGGGCGGRGGTGGGGDDGHWYGYWG